MHDFQRRWMHRVAAKIAQKIFVLFEYGDGNACAREQKPEHHPRWPCAGDHAVRVDGVHWWENITWGQFSSTPRLAHSRAKQPQPLSNTHVAHEDSFSSMRCR